MTRRCAGPGSGKAAVRIGGLTDLERLGQNNADMWQAVVDRICAYLLLSGHRYAEPSLSSLAIVSLPGDLPGDLPDGIDVL